MWGRGGEPSRWFMIMVVATRVVVLVVRVLTTLWCRWWLLQAVVYRDKSWTWREQYTRIRKLASSLYKAGVRPGM
jgi:non-ribosomal peptide synthetase component E (peptide arylation enzyme)